MKISVIENSPLRQTSSTDKSIPAINTNWPLRRSFLKLQAIFVNKLQPNAKLNRRALFFVLISILSKCRLMTTKKILQSKANWPLAQVNKFEQVWVAWSQGSPCGRVEGGGQGGGGVPKWTGLNRSMAGSRGGDRARSRTGEGVEGPTWLVHLGTDLGPDKQTDTAEKLLNTGVRHLLNHLNHWIPMDPIGVKCILFYPLLPNLSAFVIWFRGIPVEYFVNNW